MNDPRLILSLALLSHLTSGCLGPELAFEGGGGSGAGAEATTAGVGGDVATTTSGAGGDVGSTTSGGGAGGSGGAGECTAPDDCADPGTLCVTRTCEAEQCGTTPSALDLPCDLVNQLDGLCDGLGVCVACTADDQCPQTETCDPTSGACVPGCSNGDLDVDETDVDCGGSCAADCVAGEGCLEGTDCESNVCGPAFTCENGKVAFVTSDFFFGDFGGALEGDAICQEFAAGAGLSGTFMAWLSDATTSPSLRFTRSVDPYRRLDGVVVADDWDELAGGLLQASVEIDELGGTNPFAEVWTATNLFGDWVDDTCLEWTANDELTTGFAGLTSTTDGQWTTAYSQFCNRSGLRLYCFQQ